VGGCAVGLLVTDPARAKVRATVDVDLLTEVAPLSEYYRLADRLRELGFTEQHSSGVIVRWAKSSLLIDVMPVHVGELGASNPWCAKAAKQALLHQLPSGQNIRLITAPYFLATKLEAYASRGGGDYLHHDMEDIVTVIDGRHSIVGEVLSSPSDLRTFLLDELDLLLADSHFVERLSWLLPPENLASRRDITITRMRQIAGL
jgi:hypothetical protein